MGNERLFYLENFNIWCTYENAHLYGYTSSKPLSLTFYTANLDQVTLRKDTSTGELFDLRLTLPHSWVTDISDLDLYNSVGNITLYSGETATLYNGYSSSVLSSDITFVDLNSSLVSISDLYNEYGITLNKCSSYQIRDGVVLSWYDPLTNLYWDNSDGRKLWSTSPPTVSDSKDSIPLLPDPINPISQWEYDLTQFPVTACSYGSVELIHKFVDLCTTFYNFDQWDISYKNTLWSRTGSWSLNNNPPVKTISLEEWSQFYNGISYSQLYTDNYYTSIPLYVTSPTGVDDYSGTHRDFNYTFTGDMQKVWVNSDEDTTFYRGTDTFIFGKTHDTNHSLETNPIYWCSSVYMTYDDLHAAGYTLTKSTDVEIWDPSLLGKRLWEDTQWLYLSSNNNTNMNIPVINSTAKPASGSIINNSYTLSIVAKTAGASGNNLSVYQTYTSGTGFTIEIKESGVSVYSITTTNLETLNENSYCTFSGSFSNGLNTGCTVSCQLSGGTDSDTTGIRLYYSDGSSVVVVDYLNYNITCTLQSKHTLFNSNGAYETVTSAFSVSANGFSFSKDTDNNLLLVYTGESSIDCITCFSFNWDNSGASI